MGLKSFLKSFNTPCPARSSLMRLVDGSLPETEQKAIERHLWFCGSCSTAFQELTFDENGTPRPIPCPAHVVLKRHVEGSLSSHLVDAIEHHLASCPSCKAMVDALHWGIEVLPERPSCPEPSVLGRLLDGSVGEHERKAIEPHIETCNACQARLDALACGDPGWPRQVRNLKREHEAASPGLKRVIGVLKDEVHPEEAVTGAAPAAPEEILAFLDPPESSDHVGKLGPYRVIERLGHGGMGVVLKGFDPALHRLVAIKVLAPQLATSSSARQRFAREARAAAAIRNEHVVAIHSVDEWKGIPYLVMEFIPGVSLQERIDRTAPLDLNSILRIGMQAASGLAAAHAQGLVHRDIKPSNILLENCVERVKITDFGLARAVDDASLTQSGVVAGTPLFMAPEQARSETIDHRADLFSLGAVLYAMCTGRSPFRAPTTLAVLRRVCDEAPRPVREVNRDIPDWLAAIIDRLLAKEPRNRYQDASEVAAVLGRHLARRQESPAWDGEPSKPLAPAVLDDVGPAKRPGHLRRMLKLAAYLVVILAGLLVVTEVTGATRIIDSLASLLHSRVGGANLTVHVTDPSINFAIDGRAFPPRTGYFDYFFPGRTSGFVVESFKNGRKVSGRHFSTKPGLLSIELEIGRDGQIMVEYEGPIRTPKPRQVVPPALASKPDRAADETPLPLASLPLQRIIPGCAGLRIMEYSPDGRYLIVTGKAGAHAVPDMMFYDRRGACNAKLLWMGAAPRSLVFTPDSKMFITGADDGKIHVWDVSSFVGESATLSSRFPDPLATLDEGHQAVSALAVSPDGSLLASGSVNGELGVRLWKPSITAALQLKDISPPLRVIDARWDAAISSLCFSPENATLVVTLDRSTTSVNLWDITPGNSGQNHLRGAFEGAPSNAQSSSFSSDGRFLAIGGKPAVVVWDRQRGLASELPSLPGAASNQVTRVAYAKGTRHLLAVGFTDGTVSIWEDLRETARIHAHDKRVAGLAFAPNGKTLATAAADGDNVRLWDLGPVLNVPTKAPTYESNTITGPVLRPPPRVLEPPPLGPGPRGLGGAQWNEAVANEASARASFEKADARLALLKVDFEQAKSLGNRGAVEAKIVEEARLRLTVAENDLLVARAEVALAEARKEQVWVEFERERLQKLIDQLKAVANQQDHASIIAAVSRGRELSRTDLKLTRDAAAAELERAKAKLAQANAHVAFRTRQFDRIRQLHERGAVEQRLVPETEDQLRAAEADQHSAQATVSAAQARLKAAEESLKARKDP